MSITMDIVVERDQLRWTLHQLVKSGLYPDEQSVLRTALCALFQSNPQVKPQMLAAAYTSGDVSLGKAAEIMGVTQEEMMDILRDAGARIHLGPQTVEELRQDVDNA